MSTNEFDPERLNKAVVETEQKELLKKMSDAVRFHKNKQELSRIADGKRLAEDLSEIDFTTNFDEIADAAELDAIARSNAIEFLYPELSDFVMLAPGSLALICSSTGSGKSTITANIAYSLMRQGKRVLIIANEEKKQDVAARISCLQLDVSIIKYMARNVLPQIVMDNVNDNIRNMRADQLSIVALDFRNDSRIVTSPEGMISLLKGVVKKKDTPERYDAVIIDYYQNINNSISNPGLQAHEANEIFAREVDHIKNEIGCPIIMMAQIRRGDDVYVTRLEGRRLILNKCTDIFELKIDKDYQRSALIAHKARWSGMQGEEMFIAYDGKGKFIPYDRAFEEKVKSAKVSKIEALATQAPSTV